MSVSGRIIEDGKIEAREAGNSIAGGPCDTPSGSYGMVIVEDGEVASAKALGRLWLAASWSRLCFCYPLA
jgi:hypothetical protein